MDLANSNISTGLGYLIVNTNFFTADRDTQITHLVNMFGKDFIQELHILGIAKAVDAPVNIIALFIGLARSVAHNTIL